MNKFLLVSLIVSVVSTKTTAAFFTRTMRCVGANMGCVLVHQIKKHPHEAAGAVVGGYIGYRAAGDSKFYGCVGGVLTGALLVKRHRDMRIMRVQMQELLARVHQSETYFASETSAQRVLIQGLSKKINTTLQDKTNKLHLSVPVRQTKDRKEPLAARYLQELLGFYRRKISDHLAMS